MDTVTRFVDRQAGSLSAATTPVTESRAHALRNRELSAV